MPYGDKKSYSFFKMKGHVLPGINQRSDATVKTVAAEGLAGSSAFQQNKEATPVDPKKVDKWLKEQKALCDAKPGHEFKEGTCWGPGKYAAHKKRIADIKAGK